MRPVLLDTSVVVALLDRSEKRHAECAAIVEKMNQPLVTCEAVIAESCYLLRKLSGASEAVLENVISGIFQVPFQIASHAQPVSAIMRKYRDIPADFADACLIHLADVVNSSEILTLDSDFSAYRWRRTRAFDVLLAPSEP